MSLDSYACPSLAPYICKFIATIIKEDMDSYRIKNKMSYKSGSGSTKNDNIITTDKGKRIKRGPTSLHIDIGLWQEVRIMAVLKNVSVTGYVEDALRRKLDADNLEIGKQGYRVGQGGMYIPPPPASKQQPQNQNQEEGVQPPRNLEDNRLFEIDEELAALRKHVDKYWNNGKINLYVSGLKFPVSREEIIQFAIKKKDNVEPVIEVLSRIPDRTYNDEKDLMHTFAKEYHELFDKIVHGSSERLKQLKPLLSSSSGRLRRWQMQPYLDKKSSKMDTMQISIK